MAFNFFRGNSKWRCHSPFHESAAARKRLLSRGDAPGFVDLSQFLVDGDVVPCGTGDPPARSIASGWELLPGAPGLRIHTVRGNAPQLDDGRNQLRRGSLETLEATDGNPSAWQEVSFDPVSGNRLACVWAGGFGLVPGFPEDQFQAGSGATPEVVLLVDDAAPEHSEVRLDATSELDDRQAQGEARPGALPEFLAALLNLDTRCSGSTSKRRFASQ